MQFDFRMIKSLGYSIVLIGQTTQRLNYKQMQLNCLLASCRRRSLLAKFRITSEVTAMKFFVTLFAQLVSYTGISCNSLTTDLKA
jgi:hypothetical protein